jgi:hypothetical protein
MKDLGELLATRIFNVYIGVIGRPWPPILLFTANQFQMESVSSQWAAYINLQRITPQMQACQD